MSRLKREQKKSKHFSVLEPSTTDYNKYKPIFSFIFMKHRGDYCLTKCDPKEISAFATTLLHLSQMTWEQIIQAHRHGSGYEEIKRTALRTDIPTVITPDIDFIAFRFQDMKPMIGYRSNNIFHIVWIDRNLKIYKHS
jgi:hypothetical protein